jgi:hypothetical protein
MFVPFPGSSAGAYLGIRVAVLGEKRRLLLHSPVAGRVVTLVAGRVVETLNLSRLAKRAGEGTLRRASPLALA